MSANDFMAGKDAPENSQGSGLMNRLRGYSKQREDAKRIIKRAIERAFNLTEPQYTGIDRERFTEEVYQVLTSNKPVGYNPSQSMIEGDVPAEAIVQQGLAESSEWRILQKIAEFHLAPESIDAETRNGLEQKFWQVKKESVEASTADKRVAEKVLNELREDEGVKKDLAEYITASAAPSIRDPYKFLEARALFSQRETYHKVPQKAIEAGLPASARTEAEQANKDIRNQELDWRAGVLEIAKKYKNDVLDQINQEKKEDAKLDIVGAQIGLIQGMKELQANDAGRRLIALKKSEGLCLTDIAGKFTKATVKPEDIKGLLGPSESTKLMLTDGKEVKEEVDQLAQKNMYEGLTREQVQFLTKEAPLLESTVRKAELAKMEAEAVLCDAAEKALRECYDPVVRQRNNELVESWNRQTAEAMEQRTRGFTEQKGFFNKGRYAISRGAILGALATLGTLIAGNLPLIPGESGRVSPFQYVWQMSQTLGSVKAETKRTSQEVGDMRSVVTTGMVELEEQIAQTGASVSAVTTKVADIEKVAKGTQGEIKRLRKDRADAIADAYDNK